MKRASSSLAWCSLLPVLVACGSVETPASSTGAGETSWPKRATLVASFTEGDAVAPSVRLSDGTVLAKDAADLTLYQAMVLSLRAASPESICEKGTFEALADIPTDEESCAASLTGTWAQHVYLSASTLHTADESTIEGLGMLVRSAEHDALYRLRLVSDSYDAQGTSTATFDYEPVP